MKLQMGLDHIFKYREILAEKETLSRLKLAHAISPIENPMRIKVARKLVAKLETALTAASRA